MYNMTAIYGANNTLEMISGVNSASDGWFIGLLIIVLYLGSIFMLQKQNLKKVLLVSSFSLIIITIYLVSMNLIGMSVLSILIVLFFISLLMMLLVDG